MPQDMPPTGGYEPVQYKRNLPARGFRPATYLLMVGAVCTYGFWRVGQGIREQKYAASAAPQLSHTFGALLAIGSHN
jgi:NADH dehydrogenase (ubiquinone) 1 alpha subcomplex subunit 13